MASIRRALFSSNTDAVLRCSSPSESMEMPSKDPLSNECEPTADYIDVVVEEKGHGTKKVLVVCKNMTGDICKQLAGMPLLQDMPVVLCSLDNLSSVCSRNKFALVFVEKSFDEHCISEICSVIRFNTSSPNRTVAIIGVGADQDVQLSPSCGLTEVITFPLKEDTITQLLLKYAGIVPFGGLPLTPESPDDDIAVARKAEEIIRESEQQCSFLGYKDNYSQKDSEKLGSSFNGPDSVAHCVSVSSRPGSGYFTDSNNNPYLRSTSTPMVQDTITTRQSSPFVGHEMRSSLGSNNDIPRELNESFRESMANKSLTSWALNNDQISQTLPQSILPIPASYLDQVSGSHGNQVLPSQCINSCQHSRQPTPSGQSSQQSFHVSSPIPPIPASTQETNIPSQSIPNQTMTIPSTAIECQEKLLDNLSPQKSVSKTASLLSSNVKDEVSTRSSSYMVSGMPGSKDMKITMLPDDLSKHSSKERIRRERIKDSCDKLRYLLPNISGKKTDMASILEMTVTFVKLVNDQMPPAMMEEIADSLSLSTIGMVRKRAQKDLHMPKPKSSRYAAGSKPRNYPKKQLTDVSRIIPPMPVSVPSAPLTSGDVNHIIYTTFSNNNTPHYYPHGQHYNTTPHQHNQYIQGLGCTAPYSPVPLDLHPGYMHPSRAINQSITKDIPSLRMHKDTPIYHNYQPIHSSDVTMCPHRPMYGPPLSINTSTSHGDIPPQWNYMKLPSVSAISPCSSACLSSNDDPDTISGSSMSNTSFDSPLWDESK